MKNLSIDIETYSDVDLSKAGVYKYSESPNFDILLFGYAVDGGGKVVFGATVELEDEESGDTVKYQIVARTRLT